MKKLVFLLTVLCISTAVSAQLVTSTTIAKEKKQSDSGMFIDFGVGAMKAKTSVGGASVTNDADGVSLALGIGYRKAFTPNIAWDILKVNAFANMNEFSESISPQLLTGVRGTSPEFAGMTAFANVGLGYGYWIETEKGGFAYEIQVGLNVLPKLSVAFTYNDLGVSEDGVSVNLKFIGAKIGYRF